MFPPDFRTEAEMYQLSDQVCQKPDADEADLRHHGVQLLRPCCWTCGYLSLSHSLNLPRSLPQHVPSVSLTTFIKYSRGVAR